MRFSPLLVSGCLLLAGPALAADDFPAGGPGITAAHDWSGFYVGAHAGGSVDSSHWNGGGVTPPFNIDGSSFVIGGQAGYLHQFPNNWVLGVEVELSATFLEATGQCSNVAASVCRTRQDWAGSVRGRLGYAFDRLMVYGTVGVAFTDYDFDQTAPAVQAWNDGARTGWTAGLGVEYAVTEKWSAGLEWKHYDFGNQTGTGGIGPANVNFDTTSDHFAARINYHF
ncbi:outer membrane protein [Hoeflea sp.]|uniref:outer membrane protein n=1 Tax=Hoeflea sp. TaxID=1940281 RepID=UPI003B5182AE